jgi:hypothetical protein
MALAPIPWRRIALVAGGAAYALLLALATLRAQDAFGGLHLQGPLVLALAPLAIVLTLRFPLIFPFVIYVALLPFDPLLNFSSSATNLKVLGAATGGALALLTRSLLVPHASWYAWAAFTALAGTSLLWSPEYKNALFTVNEILGLFLIMTALAIYRPKPREFVIALGGIACSGVIAAVYALVQYQHGSTSNEGRLLITSGQIELDPNYLASAFTMPVALALCGLISTKNVALRIACLAAILVMMAADLSTGSRSGFITVLAVVLYFGIRTRYRIAAFSVTALALSATAFLPQIWKRFLSDEGEVGTGSGRTIIWKTAMHNFGDHWLFGLGAGSFVYNYDKNILGTYQQYFQGWSRAGHSIIFVGLNDFGVVGLALVLYCWFLSFRQLHVIPKTHPLYNVRLACEAMIVGLFFEANAIDPYYIKYIWIAHALPLMLLNMYAPREFRARVPVLDRLRPARAA